MQTRSHSVPVHFMCFLKQRNCLPQLQYLVQHLKTGNWPDWCHQSTDLTCTILTMLRRSFTPRKSPRPPTVFHCSISFSSLSPGTFLSLSGLSGANHWIECPSQIKFVWYLVMIRVRVRFLGREPESDAVSFSGHCIRNPRILFVHDAITID